MEFTLEEEAKLYIFNNLDVEDEVADAVLRPSIIKKIIKYFEVEEHYMKCANLVDVLSIVKSIRKTKKNDFGLDL